MIKLSIITINYNNLRGLKKTCDSVIAQTWKDYEWIIVDGGSTDGSLEFIERYAAEGNFAWWCSEKDAGVYNAMNKGIVKASGEYLIFMNSGDCFHDENTLRNVFSKEYVADVVYGDSYFVYEDKSILMTRPEHFGLDFLLTDTIYHQSSFIKRELLKKNGYDEKYKIVSDWKAWIVWLLEGRNFKHIDIPVADFDAQGISMVNKEARLKENIMVLKEVLPSYMSCDVEDVFNFKRAFNDDYYKEIYRLIHTRRLYKRIIDSSIKLVHFIDKYL